MKFPIKRRRTTEGVDVLSRITEEFIQEAIEDPRLIAKSILHAVGFRTVRQGLLRRKKDNLFVLIEDLQDATFDSSTYSVTVPVREGRTGNTFKYTFDLR